MKPVSSKRRLFKQAPQNTFHFVVLVLLMLALLFVIFYFFLHNTAR